MGTELNIEQAESSWTASWCSWTRQSDAMLRNVEKKILSCVKTVYKRFYVDIGCVVGQSDKIWTISLNDESTKTPLVLLHGMGAGLALWCPNLDALAAARPVYALDLLGFGRSSRPKFSSDAEKAEAQWVESVEQWRREVNLGQFILLGHSLGGYIATAYAMKYPDRVRHLILADPWGFPEKPANVNEKYQIPLWVRAIATVVQPLNPLWVVRAAGPAGSWLVSKTRPDLARKYQPYLADADALIPSYIHQCNAQTPSGESAFHSLMSGFGWAKNPMVRRVCHLPAELPVTVLYGSRSWVDNSTAQVLCEHRQPGARTYVQELRRFAHLYDGTGFISVSDIWRRATKCRKTIYEIRRQVTKGRKTKHVRVESKIITGAGHHVYLDKPELFNKYVAEACARTDEAEPAERSEPQPQPTPAS